MQLKLFELNNFEYEYHKKFEIKLSLKENLMILKEKNDSFENNVIREEITSNLSDNNNAILEIKRMMLEIESSISDETSKIEFLITEIEKNLEVTSKILDKLDDFGLFVEKHSFLSYIIDFIENFKDNSSLSGNIKTEYFDKYVKLKELLSK